MASNDDEPQNDDPKVSKIKIRKKKRKKKPTLQLREYQRNLE